MLADGLDNLVVPDRQVEPITEEPFTGSDEEARSAQSESTARLRSATERFTTTETHLNKSVTDLRAFATRAEFESAGSLREPIMVGEIADVGRRAAELTDAHGLAPQYSATIWPPSPPTSRSSSRTYPTKCAECSIF